MSQSNASPLLTYEFLETTNTTEADESDSEDIFRPVSFEYAVKLKRAQTHITRSALYGNGARSKLPRVRRKKKESTSLLTGMMPSEIIEKQCILSDSIPPGAHADQFRLVCNLTRKSLNDAESYQYTTTSMTEGISHVTAQPPWYCGYSNKTVPPDSSLVHGACRYGFRGSKGIKQYETKAYQMPSSTVTEHTPKFLDCSCRINEWVPPILANSFQTVNGLESPKLWPENTEYPNGARLKKAPTSTRYNRETTVAISDKIDLPERLTEYIARASNLDNTIRDFAKMESYKTFLSSPIRAQLDFESDWSSKMKDCASTQLRATLNTKSLSGSFQTLFDNTNKMSYAGRTAFIVQTQDFDQIKHKVKLDRAQSVLSPENRWNQVYSIIETIKGHIGTDISMITAIKIISSSLLNSATIIGSVAEMDRLAFMDLFCQIPFCTTLTTRKVSLLFNSFITTKRNHIDVVDLISILSILNHPLDTVLNKLVQLWYLYEKLCGCDEPRMDICLKVLKSCCVTDNERKDINKMFKLTFRSICYKMTLQFPKKNVTNQSPPLDTLISPLYYNESKENNLSNEYLTDLNELKLRTLLPNDHIQSSSSDEVCDLFHNNITTITDDIMTGRDARSSTSNTNTSHVHRRNQAGTKSKVQGHFSVYSISEEFLVSPKDFIDILVQCPLLLSTFEKQLTERTIECYGKDDRPHSSNSIDVDMSI